VLVVVPPKDVKDGILETDGLQRALAPATAAAGASSNTAAVAAPPATCPEGCPVEPLRDSVASMEALLREWFEGLGGSPSVRELEERFGGRWRYTSALRRRFYVRRRLVRWVEVEQHVQNRKHPSSPRCFHIAAPTLGAGGLAGAGNR
jgi:hypothetical protein